MKSIKEMLSNLFLFLFTHLFIYPAIIFSILILGLTTSWRSGLSMLISALMLKIIVKFYSRNKHVYPSKSKRDPRILSETSIYYEVPPPLSEIYYEVTVQQREQDLLSGKPLDQGPGDSFDHHDPFERQSLYCKEIMSRKK